jgi:hypothetical protein
MPVSTYQNSVSMVDIHYVPDNKMFAASLNSTLSAMFPKWEFLIIVYPNITGYANHYSSCQECLVIMGSQGKANVVIAW